MSKDQSFLNAGAPTINPDLSTDRPGQADQADWSEGYRSGVEQNHVIPNLIRYNQLSRERDESWHLDGERMENDLAEKGLGDMPPEWARELGRMENERDYNRKLWQLQGRQKHQKTLASLGGWRAITAELASYASDPVAFAVDTVAGGSAKGNAVRRLLSGGARATVAHAAVEGLLTLDGDRPSPKELAIGFGTAFALGGAVGAAFGERVSDSQQVAKSLDKIDTPDDQIDDSVGAARTQGRAAPLSDQDTSATDQIEDAVGMDVDFTRFAKVRLDSSAQGKKLAPDTRNIVSLVLHDPLSDSGRRQISVSERAEGINGKYDQFRAPAHDKAFMEYQADTKGRKGLWNFVKSQFEADDREAFNKAVGEYIMYGGKKEFHPAVKKAAEANRKYFDGLYSDEMKRVGVKGIEASEKVAWYMPKRINRLGFNSAFNRAGGDESVRKLIAESIKRDRLARGVDPEDISDEAIEVMADVYVRRARLRDPEDGMDLTEMSDFDFNDLDAMRTLLKGDLEGDDLKYALEKVKRLEELKKTDFDENEAPDMLKHRLGMDMTTEIIDDSGRTLRMADIFETNIEDLAFSYGRAASAETALAERGLSGATLKKAVREIKQKRAKSNNREGDITDADVSMAEFAYRAAMGLRPDDMKNETTRRVLGMARNTAFISKMGTAWTHTFNESMTGLAMAGPGRWLKSLPELKEISKMMRTGKGTELLTELKMHMGGLDATLARNLGQMRHELDTAGRAGGKKLRQMEDGIEGAKRLASYANLLASSTDMARKFQGVLALRQLDDYLVKGKKQSKGWRKRRESWTLTDDRMKKLQDHLKNNAKRDKDGDITSIGEFDSETQEIFESYMYRYVAEGIQEINRGNLPKFMQTPLMGMVLQFRSFEMASWTRHTLNDLSYADHIAATKFASSAMMASLAYMGRAYLISGGDDEKLDRLMTPKKIVGSGIGYSVNAGVMPALVDSVAATVGSEPVFRPVRTTGVASGLGLDGFAAWQIFEDVQTNVQSSFRQARHLAQNGELDSYSQEEVRSMFAVAGLDTLWATRWVKEWAINNFEKQSEKDTEKISVTDWIGLKDE